MRWSSSKVASTAASPAVTSDSVTHPSGSTAAAWSRSASSRAGSPPRAEIRARISACRARSTVNCSAPSMRSTTAGALAWCSGTAGPTTGASKTRTNRRTGAEASGAATGWTDSSTTGAAGGGLAASTGARSVGAGAEKAAARGWDGVAASRRLSRTGRRSKRRAGRASRGSRASGAAGGLVVSIRSQSNSTSGCCCSRTRIASSSNAARPTFTWGGERNQ